MPILNIIAGAALSWLVSETLKSVLDFVTDKGIHGKVEDGVRRVFGLFLGQVEADLRASGWGDEEIRAVASNFSSFVGDSEVYRQLSSCFTSLKSEQSPDAAVLSRRWSELELTPLPQTFSWVAAAQALAERALDVKSWIPEFRDRDQAADIREIRRGICKLAEKVDQPKAEPAPVPAGRVWNVPFSRNLNFTGRGEMLADLRNRLVEGKDVALTQNVAVHGLGGIGKTQLAVEYCYRQARGYDIIWWIRADTSDSLTGDFALLGPRIGIPMQQEQAQTVELVKESLQARDKWLLVFDNVQKPSDVDLCMPDCGEGHVIITSRFSDWSSKADALRVEVLPEPEAVEFLLKRTGRSDKSGATELARALGRLPLALEQAAAFAQESCMSFAEYLKLYHERRLELLKRGKPDKYDDTVLTTWEISFRRATEESKVALLLLAICSFLDADSIPAAMLSEAAVDKVTYAEAVAALTRYSLLTSRQEGEGESARVFLSVHRLVQEVVRDNLPANVSEVAIGAAVAVLERAFPYDSDDVRTWPDCIRLLPHATSVLGHATLLRNSPQGMASLMNQVALYHLARAEYSLAEPLMLSALASDEQSLGPEHPNVAIRLSNLASLLQATNRLSEAEPLVRRALAIDEKAHGPEHPEVAVRLNNLALLLQATNRLAEAEPLMRRVLAIVEKSYGDGHPSVAKALSNLATLLLATNGLAEAEPLMRRALAIDEKSYGPEHPDVASVLDNLARLLQASNRPTEAEPLVRRALAIMEKSYGPEHPEVARALSFLSSLLQDTNGLSESEPLVRRALAIMEKSYGPEHPEVARALSNLASLLQEMGRLSEAEPLMRRAVAIMEKSYGPEHPEIARALNDLAVFHMTTSRLSEAEPLMRRALAMNEKSFGPEHPDVAIQVSNFAWLLHDMNRFTEAEPLMRRAVAIMEKSCGPEHPNVAAALNNLAMLLKHMGRPSDAEPLMRRALAIEEKSHGAEHPLAAKAMNNLAQLLQTTNRLPEAEPLMRRALETFLKFTQATGHTHPGLEGVFANYAGLLRAMGRSEDEVRQAITELASRYGLKLN